MLYRSILISKWAGFVDYGFISFLIFQEVNSYIFYFLYPISSFQTAVLHRFYLCLHWFSYYDVISSKHCCEWMRKMSLLLLCAFMSNLSIIAYLALHYTYNKRALTLTYCQKSLMISCHRRRSTRPQPELIDGSQNMNAKVDS